MTASHRHSQPVLFVDVDGPLNPYAAMPDNCPAGYETYRFMLPVLLPMWLNPSHGSALMALPYELVWATTWKNAPTLHLVPDLRKRPEVQGATTLPWPLPAPVCGAGRGRERDLPASVSTVYNEPPGG